MEQSKLHIRIYYGDNDHSNALLQFIAHNIKVLMQKFKIDQNKIPTKEKLEECRRTLVKGNILPANQALGLPFAIIQGKVIPASKIGELLKNIITKKNMISRPDKVDLDDWNQQVLDSGDNEPTDMDNSSIAKQMEKFNKQRANRLTETPTSKKNTKSYTNDEEFHRDSGADNVAEFTYDFNSGDNILEELRLSEANDYGKVQSNKPRRKN